MQIINPSTGKFLQQSGNFLVDSNGAKFPIIRGVPRFTPIDNYTSNFGIQWNKFAKTQLDHEQLNLSKTRFFAETHWDKEDLEGKDILEVGSGAGRFSKIVLEYTQANLWSIDYSDAVTANYENNHSIAPERFHLFQASIYAMPFPDNSFDKVFCMGVLQHTPDFEASIKALIAKAKSGAEIVVDFYPIKGWWTKINAKYMLRPLTKRLTHERLLAVIEANVDWLIALSLFLMRCQLGFLTRFLPLVDLRTIIPLNLTSIQFREWAVLDTFDMFSPEYDNPQRIEVVAEMFRRNGAVVTFAGFESINGGQSAVVRGIKQG